MSMGLRTLVFSDENSRSKFQTLGWPLSRILFLTQDQITGMFTYGPKGQQKGGRWKGWTELSGTGWGVHTCRKTLLLNRARHRKQREWRCTGHHSGPTPSRQSYFRMEELPGVCEFCIQTCLSGYFAGIFLKAE